MQNKLVRDNWGHFLRFLQLERKFRGQSAAVMADKSRYNIFCDYFIDKDFNRDNFMQLLENKRISGCKDSTLNKFISMGKNIDKYLKTNVIVDFTYFEIVRNNNVEVLSADEINEISKVNVDYCGGYDGYNFRNGTLISMMGTTGCRISEALSLKREDLKDTSPLPCVIFRKTKNNDEREVPITKKLYERLLKLPKRTEYVFTSRSGKKLETPEINLDLKRRAKVCGITKNVTCHLFRHSYITTMLEMGVDSVLLCQIVGHHDPKTLLRYYHPNFIKKSEVVQMHPLLRANITWGSLKNSSIDYFTKLMRSTPFKSSLETDSKDEKLTITVYK